MKATAIIVILVLIGGLVASRAVSQARERLVSAGTAAASSYDLSWHVVAGGGGAATRNGGVALGGTVAEPGAGLYEMAGYMLCVGFWCGLAVEHSVYLPLVLRGDS